MKPILHALLLASMISTSAMADAGSMSTSKYLATSLALPNNLVECLEDMDDACLSITAGLLTTTSTVALLREEIRAVEGDAYDYLAGFPKTLALQEVIDQVRIGEERLANISDEAVVSMLLKTI